MASMIDTGEGVAMVRRGANPVALSSVRNSIRVFRNDDNGGVDLVA